MTHFVVALRRLNRVAMHTFVVPWGSRRTYTSTMTPDFLVVGAGVAGLRAAIELARFGEVLVIAKAGLRESSSEYAQGGIAVALERRRRGGTPRAGHARRRRRAVRSRRRALPGRGRPRRHSATARMGRPVRPPGQRFSIRIGGRAQPAAASCTPKAIRRAARSRGRSTTKRFRTTTFTSAATPPSWIC